MTAGRLELSVSAADAGERLDRFLAGPIGSRAQAQSLIEAGRVRVNGSARPKRVVLRAGDVVEVVGGGRGQEAPTAAPAPFRVAYEDEHLLVVDKPAGVVVHPARGHPTGTLAQALEGRGAGGGEPGRAGIVHRLDRDTSGLLVVAKDAEVHRALKALLASRRLRREYAALVAGHPSARTGTIDAPLGRDRRDRLKVSINTDHPRPARTHFEVEQVLRGTALLRVALETGRTHQIRAHLAAIGHPVCGDPLYGTPGEYGLKRQFLHADHLSFRHPVTAEPIDVRSELPADLEQALGRAAAAG
ncbi:MAG TPA: RluA family pseudouridine synthase [Solirubrobacteraceae bacterium]|nr:RluA family pseudouridine synthase [Solirubrobacteraceae bacterium]